MQVVGELINLKAVIYSRSACKSPNETTHGVQSYVDFVSGSRKVIISEGLYPSFKDVLFQSQQPQKSMKQVRDIKCHEVSFCRRNTRMVARSVKISLLLPETYTSSQNSIVFACVVRATGWWVLELLRVAGRGSGATHESLAKSLCHFQGKMLS